MGLDCLIQFRQRSSTLMFCVRQQQYHLGFILFRLRLATGDPRASHWHKLQPPSHVWEFLPSHHPEHVAENNIHL